MKAGPGIDRGSVRPKSGGEDSDSESLDFCRVCLDVPVGIYSGTLDDSDDEDELGEPPEDLGVTCERVGLSREEDFVKVLVDPKLPSKRDVEMHYLMNHLPYRLSLIHI